MLYEPCIGMWTESRKEERNIAFVFNRNLNVPMEPNTLAFVGSPELVTALAIAGDSFKSC
jgi:aconitate hydratase